ncbi:hypothetical protein ACFLT7_01195 [candidate division KSB1 bacterium]
MSNYTITRDDDSGIDRIHCPSAGSSIAVSRFGGELVSYRVRDPRDGAEVPLLYRDNQTDAPEDGWKNHATILFPIVGGLKGKQSRLGDLTISTRGNHGLARHSDFILADTRQTAEFASLQYQIEASEATREYYPFDFSLKLIYTLAGSDLSLDFVITNREAERDIYFCFGWHPGFRAPLGRAGNKSGCRLLFPDTNAVLYHNNDECRLTGETTALRLGGPFGWTEEGLERTVMLEFPEVDGRRVTLSDSVAGIDLEMDFADFPQLGFWSEPGWDFICIEPWQGMDDHEDQEPFDQKVGMVRLPPGEEVKKAARVKARFK